jgi:hypothetical protein
MVSAGYLFMQNLPIRSFIFPLVFSQMQLIEGLRWIHAFDERVLAVAAKLVLYAQPVAGLYQAGETRYIVPYVVAQTFTELVAGSHDYRFVVGGDGHFVWKWLNSESLLLGLPYWIALTYATYKLLPFPLFLVLAGLYQYYKFHHSQYRTEGSLWCVAVNMLWIYYLLKTM